MTAQHTVFVHAVGFTGATLAPVAAGVPGSSLCLDLVGHGAATPPTGHVFSWRDAAERLLEEFRTRRGEGAPRLGFGHSGGGIALLYCEILQPGTFDALFLYEPPIRLALPEAFAETAPTLADAVRRRRDSFAGPGDFERHLRARAPYRDFADAALIAYAASGVRQVAADEYVLACAPEFEATIYGTAEPELVERLGEVRIPVVIAQGARTHERFAAVGEALTQRLPHGRRVVVPGVTHFGPMEDPGLVADVFVHEIDGALAADDRVRA